MVTLLHKQLAQQLQYFSDLGVTRDLIHFSEVVCSCSGTKFLEFKIELSHTKNNIAPAIAITTSDSSRGESVWYVPPKQDWIDSGVTNIDEFWVPSAADRAIDFVKTAGKTRYETRPMSALREADCIK